ncbi:MAG: hypothetical protein ACLTLQ_03620 [[Clostridium] scindens]
MNVIPNIDLSNYERAFTVLDTHTQGEFTRIVLDGMPKTGRNHDSEKRKYLLGALWSLKRGAASGAKRA